MRLLITTLLFLCSSALLAQTVAGDWQGMLPAGGKQVRIVFHIVRTGSGYNATFDSPDQGASGLGVTGLKVTTDSIFLTMPAANCSFEGRWDGADQLTGLILSGPMRVPLTLKRLPAVLAPPGKPQTPKPPFDYLVEEVGYQNKTQNIPIAGTFTRPKNGTKFPVVLLITGSGAQDRDGTIGLHKPFWVIADQLTKQGIAVLRVDDRGTGQTGLGSLSATSADFATDVMAGIEYLASRKDVDVNRIGLIGHSEGAIIAPYVAARSNKVAFIVMLAGPVEGGLNTMYYQAVTKPLDGAAETARNAYGVLYNQLLQVALQDSIAKNIKSYITRTYLNWKRAQSVATLETLVHGASDQEAIESFVSSFRGIATPWFRFFLTYDPQQDIRKLQIPVLALNGEKDEQVNPANLTLIKNLLTANGNPHFKTYQVPGVNHLFQHCKECGSVAEYLSLDETFDAQAIAMIAEWIKGI